MEGVSNQSVTNALVTDTSTAQLRSQEQPAQQAQGSSSQASQVSQAQDTSTQNQTQRAPDPTARVGSQVDTYA